MLARHKWALARPYQKCCLRKNAFRAMLHFVIKSKLQGSYCWNISETEFIERIKNYILKCVDKCNDDSIDKCNPDKLDTEFGKTFKMFLDMVRAIHKLFDKFKDRIKYRYELVEYEDLVLAPLSDLFKKENLTFDESLFYIITGSWNEFRDICYYLHKRTWMRKNRPVRATISIDDIYRVPMRMDLYHIIHDLINGNVTHPLTNEVTKQMESCDDYDIWQEYKNAYAKRFTIVKSFLKWKDSSSLWIPK